ncbi:hypothetical protein ACFR99_01165 [Haloarchaeobius amylolyticus]|uniref:Uncharacterized protein n=1 Tax=Haloarchaeobius amylolyticus TaxID=1198296 RepID=A0ABD6BC72_9EURY
MSNRNDGFVAVGWWLSTARVVPSSIFVVPLSVLLVASVFGEFGQAAATVGFVLAEALVLYVGYGILMHVASPAAREILVSA